MSITDHVAILLSSSLLRAAPNRKNPQKPPQFYAVAAFPASAGQEIADAMTAIAPGGRLNAVEHWVSPNAKLKKPHPGIPDDALVVRFASQFAPALYDDAGNLVGADVAQHAASQFFAGQRVRIDGSPWLFADASGIAWNLAGVMAVGGGERRATASDAFAKYLPVSTDSAATPAAKPEAASPFGAQGAATAAAATAGNPFQQANAGNPFG